MRWIQFFAFTLVLSAMQTATGDDHKDRDPIDGAWLASSAELSGKPFPEEVRKSIKLTIKDGKYTVRPPKCRSSRNSISTS